MTAQNFYSEKLLMVKKTSALLQKKHNLNAFLRLTTFLLIFVLLFSLLNIHQLLAFGSATLSLIGFLLLVRRHVFLQNRRNYFSELEKILTLELEACHYNFGNLPAGEKFINHHHSYSYDLDLFGAGSLFQMINRTVTTDGALLLVDELNNGLNTHEQIQETQKALKELSAKPDMLLHFRATGNTSKLADDEKLEMLKWLGSKSFLDSKKYLKFLTRFFAGAAIIALLLLVFGIMSSGLFVSLFFINLSLVALNLRRINQEHARISRFLKMIDKYRNLLQVIEEQNFESKELQKIKESFHVQGTSSWQSLDKLVRLVSTFDNRLNFVIAIFLEGVLLWDYHCLFAIEKWKQKYGQTLPDWFESIAKFDVLVSKAVLTYNYPSFQFPELSDSIVFDAKLLGHPLIPESSRIGNDFSLKDMGTFHIITGANMAGKSTFLRTVGVNMVIGKMGLPVCAKSLTFKPFKLFTSMRTSDSLAENESYFYAELKRLQEMFILLDKNEPLFIILDEILKGTNSVDKQRGSFAAMEKILGMNGTGIIATHDLTLTEIAGRYNGRVVNQCFEIEIDEAIIKFDYKLYAGVTQKMNAMLLMQQMGII